ncbi:MAG: SprT family zinc-dependent metalloprotease [Sphingobium sp.]
MSTASSDAPSSSIMVDGVAMPVRVRRSARAKAYRLTLDGPRGELRLSLPVRASLDRALGWAQQHEPWVRTQLLKQPETVPLCDGAHFPLEGRERRICWAADAPRAIRLYDDRLILGGAAESVGRRVLQWLRNHAREVLETETRALAAQHGLRVASVGVGDTRSRWGSCTAGGAIRYSWRLILCPPSVRRATVAHELAHLLHMDHSPAFHAAHARLLGENPQTARAWLRVHGHGLHRYVG